ncbi:hypothetical protein EON76_02095 [bacterium]|nr:MAG: hypothetical protein EON76_02095 [bacterium]
MDDDPQNRNHVPIHEKAHLYRDVDEILRNDSFTQVEQMDEDDKGEPVFGLFVDLQASNEGPMSKSGFNRVVIARSEAHIKNGSSIPERTIIASYGELGNPEEVHQYVVSVDDGYPDIALRQENARFIPDSLDEPASISQEEALNARRILSAVKSEIGMNPIS